MPFFSHSQSNSSCLPTMDLLQPAFLRQREAKTASYWRRPAWQGTTRRRRKKPARIALSARTGLWTGSFCHAGIPAYATAAWSIFSSARCAGSLWGNPFLCVAPRSKEDKGGPLTNGERVMEELKAFLSWCFWDSASIAFPSIWSRVVVVPSLKRRLYPSRTKWEMLVCRRQKPHVDLRALVRCRSLFHKVLPSFDKLMQK